MFYGAKPITFIRARNLRNEMTKSESLLWNKLQKNQLLGFRFKPQHPIQCFIADFYCHKARLVVEIDGKIHLQHVEYDKARTEVMEQYGLNVIRFTNEEIEEEIEKVIGTIKEFLITIM